MSSELDLELGDPDAAEEITARERRRRERAARSGNSSTTNKSPSKAATASSDRDLQARLETAIGKIADQFEAREDHEAAAVLREETKPMASGTVSLTRSVTVLRQPLALFVELLEPTLAFFRVGRMFAERWYARRMQPPEESEYPTPVHPDAMVVNP